MLLHSHRYGPVDQPIRVLALHGLTGHGKRWAHLAQQHLGDIAVLAPDLVGHGYSSANPPWSLEAHVDAVDETLRHYASEPVIVVGHSFGGAIALHLAQRHPDLVRSLVLLDPAVGLNPADLASVAQSTVHDYDYTDAAEARADKVHGAWHDVPAEQLDAEIADHLVTLASGRVSWRMFVPTIVAAWGELARPVIGAQVPVTVVVADQVQPPYATPELIAALQESAPSLDVRHVDSDHMVAQSRPDLVESVIRDHLAR